MTILEHEQHGTCKVSDEQVEEFIGLGWKESKVTEKEHAAKSKAQAQAQESDDESDDESDADIDLADLVDDRALPGLQEIGVETIDDFREADVASLLKVKYVTQATVDKVAKA